MASTYQVVRDAIERLKGREIAEGFSEGELKKLYEEGYSRPVDFRRASRESLLEIGLRKARVDALLSKSTAGVSEELNKVTLVWSTQPDEITRRDLTGYTPEQLFALVERMGGQTLVSLDELPEGWEEWKEEKLLSELKLRLKPLEKVEIEDGATYLLVFLITKLTEQVKALSRWQESLTSSFEAAAAERAVQTLREAGHDNVRRFCLSKKVRKAGEKGVKVEIDAAATAENCGLVVECKAVLDKAAAQQLERALSTISALAEEGEDAVEPFRGKRLLGALCGHSITTHAKNRQEMEVVCKANGFEVWLPGGANLGIGDGCFESPHLFGPPGSSHAAPPPSSMAGPPTSGTPALPTSDTAGPPIGGSAAPSTSAPAAPPTSAPAGPPSPTAILRRHTPSQVSPRLRPGQTMTLKAPLLSPRPLLKPLRQPQPKYGLFWGGHVHTLMAPPTAAFLLSH